MACMPNDECRRRLAGTRSAGCDSPPFLTYTSLTAINTISDALRWSVSESQVHSRRASDIAFLSQQSVFAVAGASAPHTANNPNTPTKGHHRMFSQDSLVESSRGGAAGLLSGLTARLWGTNHHANGPPSTPDGLASSHDDDGVHIQIVDLYVLHGGTR